MSSPMTLKFFFNAFDDDNDGSRALVIMMKTRCYDNDSDIFGP